MATKKLTDKTVKSLKTNKTSEFVWDEGFSVYGGSFGVRVFKSGTKKYYLNYRNQHGRQGRVNIGDVAKISLSEARKKATAELVKVDKGEDPAQRRVLQKKAETFEELADLYLELHAKPNKKPSGYKNDKGAIDRDLVPAIGHMKVNKIERRDIIAILDTIKIKREAPVLASRTQALINKIFNFAIERGIIQNSPCSHLPKLPKVKPRDRVLNDNEIKKVLKAIETEDILISTIFKLLFLTGKRSTEVSGMKWSELNKSKTKWTIPAERSKNNETHTIPLAPLATKLLKKIEREFDYSRYETDFIFPSQTKKGTHIKWLTKATQRILNQTKKLTKNKKPIPSFTPHDIRRTFTTKISEMGIRERTLKKLLNHIGNQSVTEKHYNFHSEEKEMKAALKKWNNFILKSIIK